MKKIIGFENYEISENGKIMNSNQKILKPRYRNGYLICCLWKNGKTVYKLVHRLVAKSFIPNPNNYEEVNHMDGNKMNNHYKNLEWCTRKQNMTHANNNNLVVTHPRPILQYSMNDEFIREWSGSSEAAKFYKCHRSTFERVCRGENKSGKGFVWKYKYPNEIYDEEKSIPIEDFEHYRVDILGNIINSNNKILKYVVNKSGYAYVTLCKNGKKKNMYVSQIVASSFIPNPNNYIYTRHKNDDILNNSVDNLEWWGNSFNS